MNRKYYEELFTLIDYPQEGRESLNRGYDKLCAMGMEAPFDELVLAYAQDANVDYDTQLKRMEKISKQANVPKYQGDLLLLIAMTEQLRSYYEERGIALSIWRDTVCDLKYKSLECKKMYDVWGIFSPEWFYRFFNLTAFAFGKLQFEVRAFGENFQLGEVALTEQDKVIKVHIPYAGEPLDRASTLYAYTKAKEFFKEVRYKDKTVFACRSWLLFQKHREILKSGSNLYQFIDDYQVVVEGEYPDYKETWRLFYTEDLSDTNALPRDTSLQRAYIEMMQKGERTGWAYGAFLF